MKRIATILIATILILVVLFSVGSKIEVNTQSFTFRLVRFITFRGSEKEIIRWTAHQWPVQNMGDFAGVEDDKKWILYKKWRLGNNTGETPYEHDLHCFKGSVSEGIGELYDSGRTNEIVGYWLTEFEKRKANQSLDPIVKTLVD